METRRIPHLTYRTEIHRPTNGDYQLLSLTTTTAMLTTLFNNFKLFFQILLAIAIPTAGLYTLGTATLPSGMEFEISAISVFAGILLGMFVSERYLARSRRSTETHVDIAVNHITRPLHSSDIQLENSFKKAA
ncbi:MAG: hypothetical protein AAF570_17170, partial [Bacteroidota bacterium]